MAAHWVALGDSLTQGMQSFGAAEYTRRYGYFYRLAQMAGLSETAVVPPRIADPGWPLQLELALHNPLRSLWAFLRQAGRPLRENSDQQAHNLAIGGLTLPELRHLTVENRREVALTRVVRRLAPAVYLPSWDETAADIAARLQPETVFCWIGHNDTLIALFANQPQLLTSEALFQRLYRQLVEDLLERTTSRLVLATLLPFEGTPFWQELRRAPYLSDPDSAGGFLDRLPLSPVQGGPLQQLEAALHEHLRRLNAFLLSLESDRVLVVDTADAYQAIRENGLPLPEARLPFRLAGGCLTLAYARRLRHGWREGGLVSLDGLHPSRTGYAFIAEWFAQQLRRRWGWRLPSLDLADEAARDPLLLRPPWLAHLMFRLGMRLYVRGVG